MQAFSFISVFVKGLKDRAWNPAGFVHVGNRLTVKDAVSLSAEWAAKVPREADAVSVWQFDSVAGWRHVRTEAGLETVDLSFPISAEPGQFLASAMATAIQEHCRCLDLIQMPSITESVALKSESLLRGG